MFLSAQAAEHASSVAEIVATEQVASLALFVGQVSPWGLHHTDDTNVDVRHCHRALNEKKDSGNWGKRRNEDLKGELTAKVLQRANASHEVRALAIEGAALRQLVPQSQQALDSAAFASESDCDVQHVYQHADSSN